MSKYQIDEEATQKLKDAGIYGLVVIKLVAMGDVWTLADSSLAGTQTLRLFISPLDCIAAAIDGYRPKSSDGAAAKKPQPIASPTPAAWHSLGGEED